MTLLLVLRCFYYIIFFMKVSIIVPAYNEENRIGKTLESLCAQTYPHIELIVVDNNSSDGTGEIARQFTDRVISETRKGYLWAVSTGASVATGDLIAFCDSDTRYPPEWVSQMVAVFEAEPKTVAVYGGCWTYDSGWTFGDRYYNSWFYFSFLMLSICLGLDNTSGFNFMMRRSAYTTVGGYDPAYQRMSPDVELGQRLKKVGKVRFINRIKVIASYRRFNQNGTFWTGWLFFLSWAQMVLGFKPSRTYKQYSQDTAQ